MSSFHPMLRLLEETHSLGGSLGESSQALREIIERLSAELPQDSDAWPILVDYLAFLERRIRTALRARRATADLASAVEILSRIPGASPDAIYELIEQQLPLGDLYRYEAIEIRPGYQPTGAAAEAYDADSWGDPYVTVGMSLIQRANPGELESVWHHARAALVQAGYEILVEGAEESGSVLKKWAIRGTRRAARNLAKGAAAAASDTYVRKPGSEATRQLAASVAEMIRAMGEREGVHCFDNLVIGQFRGADGELRSFSRELTAADRRAIERDPTLLSEPASLLARLRAVREPEGPRLRLEDSTESPP